MEKIDEALLDPSPRALRVSEHNDIESTAIPNEFYEGPEAPSYISRGEWGSEWGIDRPHGGNSRQRGRPLEPLEPLANVLIRLSDHLPVRLQRAPSAKFIYLTKASPYVRHHS